MKGETMPGGYAGRFLRVDLTARRCEPFQLPEATLRRFIGGSGLGAHLLFEGTGADTDPLGPGNLLLFLAGPLTGTAMPTSGRHAVVAKSPLGIWGEADCGGTFGHALKRAGWDGIVCAGRSETPVYLSLADGAAALGDAADLWGRDTFETDAALRQRHGARAAVCAIGPAGERMAPMAAILNDAPHGRAAGRCGLGAVMGAKGLKAIVAMGTGRPPVADEARFRALVQALQPRIREKTAPLRAYGTASGVLGGYALGDMPIQNWRRGVWEGIERLSGEEMARTILVGRYACKVCPIGCGRVVAIRQGPYAGLEGAGPEYEALASMGSLCLVDDMAAVARASEICNRLGLDTMSAGSAVAFAMEAWEHGLIGPRETDGLDLSWGNTGAVVRLVEMMGLGEGLGALLARGVRAAAKAIGGGADRFALEVKGLELPLHDPRALSSLALGYATSPRGACHRGCTHYLERGPMAELGFPEALDRHAPHRKGEAVAVSPGEVVACLNAVTGWDMDLAEFLRAGERASNLKRLYNVRLGFSRREDRLPDRILREPLPEGGARGFVPHLGAMLDDYYRARGWSAGGIPTPERLRALGLEREGEAALAALSARAGRT